MQTCFTEKLFLLLSLMLTPLSYLSAQLPQCSMIYIDQYGGTGLPPTNIYTYNPLLPESATNPSLNSIHTPSPQHYGLTISEVLNSGNSILTFYIVIDDEYWYYNPTTSAWVNTQHTTGSGGNAYNIASGGGFIYNLDGSNGDVYVYNGTGNGTFLTNVPDFVMEGPFDLIADCAGNFYVLNVTDVNFQPFLRKYNSSGVLVKSWTVNNPNGYFLGNGSGQTAGFGIIGSTIYVDDTQLNGAKRIVQGTINNTTVDFSGTSTLVTLPFATDVYPGDFGSCASSIPVIPQITITASATTITIGTSVTFTTSVIDGGTNPQYQWYVNNILIPGATANTYTYVPEPDDVVTCQLTSNLPCVTTAVVWSNAITIHVECPPDTLQYENAVFCKDIGNVKPVFSPSGGTFSISPIGLSINSSTGELDVNSGALGTYVVTYFVPATAYCPAVTLKDTVTLAASAAVKISMNDYFICVNEDVTLATDVVQGYSYKWTPKPYFPFGDSSATAKARIVGSGTVYVTISNNVGCMGTDSVSFSPVVCCDVMVPNAFSPNNDGLNDDFRIYTNTNQKMNQISVYNRYGKRIFYSKDQNKGWDGTDNSVPLPPGVFYYFVSYECANGEVFVKKGDVTLMR